MIQHARTLLRVGLSEHSGDHLPKGRRLIRAECFGHATAHGISRRIAHDLIEMCRCSLRVGTRIRVVLKNIHYSHPSLLLISRIAVAAVTSSGLSTCAR